MESVLAIAVAVLGVFGIALAIWGGAQAIQARDAENNVAQLKAAQQAQKQASDETITRLENVIRAYKARLAEEADAIAKLESPDERAAHLKALGSVIDVVPPAPAAAGKGS